MTPEDDLDRLVAELDTGRLGFADGGTKLDLWLGVMAERGASDLLLLAGEPPALRLNGRVVRAEGTVLDGQDVEDMVLPVLPAHAQRRYRDAGSVDAARRLAGLGRFRIHLHRERGRAAAVVRMLPTAVPSLASLDLPAGTEALSRLARGLVIIGGATGSGKTTTAAALVDETSVVCSVDRTRWPVSPAARAIRIVSGSRISPTTITSGACRSADRSAAGKSGASPPISICWTTLL